MFLKKVELPYDPAVPLLRPYLEKMKTLIQKVTYTSLFIAALFIRAKTWKEARCSSIDKLVKKLWYIYTMEYYSAIRRMKQCHCSNMDGPRDYYTKKSQKKTNTI